LNFEEEFLGNTLRGNPKVHMVQRSTTDVLEQADALPFWTQDYTQLSKGTFSGALTSVDYQGLQIFRETMNRAVDEIACAPVDAYVIGLPAIIEGDATWGLLPVKTNSLITLDKNAELIFRTSKSSEITAAVISAQRLEEYAALVEWIDLRKVMGNVKPVERLSPEIAGRLQTSLTDGMRYISEISDTIDIQQMWRHFEDDLMVICLQALLQANDSPSPHYDQRVHRYIVNRVRDSTLSSSGYPLTIGELCTDLRISRRTLNHAFIKVLGITPVSYMRNVRLHRIRAELQLSPHNVRYIASVATKWGFWHMSLFSRYYRELFGETPIETLVRARVGERKS
jgi:AraC family transcriptional regulator, ethanolamine operon transcriptional activator